MSAIGAAGPGERTHLQQSVGARQFFTLAFGAIIGVGWVVVLGEWLAQAGPVGAILGFVGGGLVMLLVGLCYAEVATMLPVSGGEVAYAYEIFGTRASFGVGWLLALVYISAVAYLGISAGWVLDILLPGTAGPTLYGSGGGAVGAGTLLIGVGGTALFTWLHYRGIASAARLQDVMTWALLAASVVFIGAGLVGGDVAHLTPAFRPPEQGTALGGVLAVMVTAPWWFGGFNVIPQVMEEKSAGTALSAVGRVIILSIVLAGLYYALVILSASMAAPWATLVDAELPAAAAFEAAFGSPALARLVLVAGLLGILTTWNTLFIAGSRVLFALGRARIIHPAFGRVHVVHGSPTAAVLFVGGVASAGVLVGRSAILPIINVGATCLAVAYLVTAVGLIRLRRTAPDAPRPYRIPGGVATAAAAALATVGMLGVSLWQPWAASAGRVPLEWWFLGAWVTLGALFWMLAGRTRAGVDPVQRRKWMMGAREG